VDRVANEVHKAVKRKLGFVPWAAERELEILSQMSGLNSELLDPQGPGGEFEDSIRAAR
jgi:hypothetical protein